MTKLTEQFKNLKNPKKSWVLSILKPLFKQFNEKYVINPHLNNGEGINTEHCAAPDVISMLNIEFPPFNEVVTNINVEEPEQAKPEENFIGTVKKDKNTILYYTKIQKGRNIL